MESAHALSEAIRYAQSDHARNLIIESAGLFWIFAELLILLAVIAGRRYLETVPLPNRFAWTRALTLRAVAFGVIFFALCAVTYGRHLLWPPLAELLRTRALDSNAIYMLSRQRTHQHLALWGAFVTGWVVLECLIVWHGWRGYRRLRELLEARQS
jgi:hypothetical protein